MEKWIEYRSKSSGQITGERWLIRNLWNKTTPTCGPGKFF